MVKIDKLDVVLVCSLILLVFAIGLNVYSSLQKPDFTPEDCEIFKNLNKPIEYSGELKFFPLEPELCNYCNVKC